MDDATYAYWQGWRDARAGSPPVPDDHAEPVAYLAGYRFGRKRPTNPQRRPVARRVGIRAGKGSLRRRRAS